MTTDTSRDTPVADYTTINDEGIQLADVELSVGGRPHKLSEAAKLALVLTEACCDRGYGRVTSHSNRTAHEHPDIDTGVSNTTTPAQKGQGRLH